MVNYRKEQMKLAVLYEVKPESRKNGDIVNSAEQNFVHDERYNEMMLNGKQTKGRKELQFILYDFKKDGIIETVKRGVFRQSNTAWNTLMEMIYKFKYDINEGKLKPEEIILTEEMQNKINEIYGDGSPWVPRLEKEPDDKGGIDFSNLVKFGWTPEEAEKIITDKPDEESGGSLIDRLAEDDEVDMSNVKLIYAAGCTRVTEDEHGRTRVQFMESNNGDDKNETSDCQVENEGVTSADEEQPIVSEGDVSEDISEHIETEISNSDLVVEDNNETSDCQVENEGVTSADEEQPVVSCDNSTDNNDNLGSEENAVSGLDGIDKNETENCHVENEEEHKDDEQACDAPEESVAGDNENAGETEEKEVQTSNKRRSSKRKTTKKK